MASAMPSSIGRYRAVVKSPGFLLKDAVELFGIENISPAATDDRSAIRGRSARLLTMMNIFGGAALSRRGFLIAIAATIAVAGVPAFAAKDASAKAFLESIYEHYVGGEGHDAKGIALGGAKIVRSYFTVGLASLILEDRANAAKRGEPPVLDGDPFVGHQEWNIANLSIEVKDAGAVKATGIVSFTNDGKPEKIVLELLRSGNDWRIADIRWESGSLRGLYRRKAAGGLEIDPH